MQVTLRFSRVNTAFLVSTAAYYTIGSRVLLKPLQKLFQRNNSEFPPQKKKQRKQIDYLTQPN